MPGATAANLSLLLLRVVLGVVFLAHGINHVFRGGKIPGTARWFESLGMKPGVLHAWLASLTELGSGALLVVGLLTPLAGAGVVGVMVVAWVTDIAGQYSDTKSAEFTVNKLGDDEIVQLRLSEPLLRDYPVAWGDEGVLFSERSFSRIEKFVDWNFFRKAEAIV